MTSTAPTIPVSSPFDHRLVIAAGLSLQPADPRRGVIIKELDQPALGMHSPIQQMLRRELEIPPDAIRVFSEEETAEMIYLFTRPIEECRAALDAGRAEFRKSALRSVEDRLPEMLIEQLFSAVVSCLEARMNQQPLNQSAQAH